MTHRILSLALCAACAGCSSSTPATAVELESSFILASACRAAPLTPLHGYVVRAVEDQGRVLFDNGASCGTATSCEAYLACYGLDLSGTCTDGQRACVGPTRLRTCEGGHPRTVECASQSDFGNDRCITGTTTAVGGTSVGCGTGTCETNGSRCEGDAIVECSNGIESRTRCGAVGATCAQADGRAFCVHQVEACTANRCDGDILLECVEGVGMARHDCRVLAGPTGTCMPSGECGASEPECSGVSTECQGTIARVCVLGTWESFDCGAVEGGTCRASGDTVGCVVE